MTIKELIRHLQCMDENHHVIVQDTDTESAKDITNIKFGYGQYCVIEVKDDYWKVR